MSEPSPPDDAALLAAAEELGRSLRARGFRLATAESCTGGLVGQAVTSVAGSSDYYAGGVISYANRAKQVELGVPPALIDAKGAVSAEVAAAMADGVRSRFSVDLGLAVTGIAGPTGGSPDKPVGLTFVAVSRGAGPAVVERRVWQFDRDGNRRAAALAALRLAADVNGRG